MRELRVEDALLYLDQVKVEFGDRPQIYNEFLDIMKTFKTQQLDTPGVIRRVSTLFRGNKKLVLGFNTFLPEGYKIEVPGDGPPVATYSAPGQGVTQILGPGLGGPMAMASLTQVAGNSQGAAKMNGAASPQPSIPPPHPRQGAPPMQHQPQQQQLQQGQSQSAVPPPSHGPQPGPGGVMPAEQMGSKPPPAQQHQSSPHGPSSNGHGQDGHAPTAGGPQPEMSSPQGPVQPGGTVPKQGYGPPQPPPQDPKEPPVEFDHAINYVTTIKKRFAGEPDTYKKFLEILHTYQKEQRGIKEVLDEVSTLFADHPDLLKQFTYFLPDAVQAQAKAQLDAVAKEAEARKRAASSKQAIMQTAQGMQRQAIRGQPIGAGGTVPARAYGPQVNVPFGATQGRSDEREREICRTSIYGSVSFNPVRPPKRNALSVKQAAMKNGRPQIIPDIPRQPTSSEAAFFERAKLHLNRRELAPDKPPGSRRHTPYTEFLKCLHLYGAEILNKEELMLMLRGLFMQGHAPKSGINAGGGASNPAVANDATELLKEFEEILVGRGPFAEQEQFHKDLSKYGALSLREYDFEESEIPTPSYRTYPSDFPKGLFFSHSGRTETDASVLNNEVVCIAPGVDNAKKRRTMWSPEAYDGVRARHNANEAAMFKVEDERYEVDMAIERNVVAMRQVEPMAEEVTHLRENEEKDGQPIGRMQYSLRSRALNCTQISAIARLYGDRGDEVVQHLMCTPVAVLPIIYKRLREKDAEWRKAKGELGQRWNAICEANYEGSLDVLCHSYKDELEAIFGVDRLLEDCKRTGHFVRHPRESDAHPAIAPFKAELSVGSPDPSLVLYQPFVRIAVGDDMLHKDAFHLISHKVLKTLVKTEADRERVSRIWAEWMAPWFSYEAHWIMDELRKSSGGDNGVAVKFVPGQKVRTAYGDGVIISRIAPGIKVGLRYKIKLPYGNSYIAPSSVIHLLPADDASHKRVRRNGVMEPVDLLFEDNDPTDEVNPRCNLMFSTEVGYLFMRLYCLLTSILTNTHEYLTSNKDLLEEERRAAPNTSSGGISATISGDSGDSATSTRESSSKPTVYDYGGMVTTLESYLKGNVDVTVYENYCHKLTKKKVYQLMALPKLIEKCANSLFKLAQEDEVTLRLFDLAQLKIMAPERLRQVSVKESNDACYRLQYDPVERNMYFSYVAPGEKVMLVPQEPAPYTPYQSEQDEDGDEGDETMDDEEESEQDAAAEEDVAMADATGGFDTAASEGVGSGASSGDDNDMGEPKAKRPKL